ncbi:MAG: hypothetical protein LR017_00610 [Candidatus Pacebacteria bacterium]|nr:hypothetical protein [Candidatus Paceibacterota bacterium]
MSDVEKQEGQKTVVAFIAGLLIGGLLVWVFSAPATQEEEVANTNEEPSAADTAPAEEASEHTLPPAPQEAPEAPEVQVSTTGEGAVTVSNQTAGTLVTLDDVTYPTTDGWIGVRDYIDGVPGRVLGAARYSTTVGLTPTAVNLLRATEAGQTYQVVFYTENGDRVFDLADDVEMEGESVIFTAK